jgi:methylated-DNA-protein-cysteine methyltransferase related protein
MAPGFSTPPDPQSFKLHVWEIVRQIPIGKVATYGQIAKLISPLAGVAPEEYRAYGPRWVGWAMASCPANIPWQRVVNSQGKISLGGSAKTEQQSLLEAEGIIFNEHEKINLKQYQWVGPI